MFRGRRFGVLGLLAMSLPALAASPDASLSPLPERGAPCGSPSHLSWALKPGVLERLSPGARQAVLAANGLAPAPARTGGPAAQARGAARTSLSPRRPRRARTSA